MNREILIDALEELDTRLIERYFEIKEKLRRKRIVTKSVIKLTAFAACVAVFVGIAVPICLKISKQIELPVDESTIDIHDDTTEAPIKNNMTISIDNVIHGGHYPAVDNAGFRFKFWNGLNISQSLKYVLGLYEGDNEKYFAINIFRRNGEDLEIDYVYKGYTYREICSKVAYAENQSRILKNMIAYYGEVIKYGKEILTTTGIPQDEPIYEIRGTCISAKAYDDMIEYINKYDSETYMRYIENGEFYKEKARQDYYALCWEYEKFNSMLAEMCESYFCRYEVGDVELFKNMGFFTGEVNGKLYIIVSRKQFESLAGNAKMKQFTFGLLSKEDCYAIFSVSEFPNNQDDDT